jgi:hypothetical protein
MNLSRPLLLLALAATCWLGGCFAPGEPPRVVAGTSVYRVNTALLLASDDGKLTAEQLQARRDEVVNYLTERGLLTSTDVLVSNAAAADRIIRVSIAESGGFKITVFNPGSAGGYYSANPALTSPPTIPDSPNWPNYDPWFDRGYYYNSGLNFGYYPYDPPDYLRPANPRDYFRPVEPRRTPPPPVIVAPVPPPPARPRDHDRDHDNRPDHRDRDGSRPHYPPPATNPEQQRSAPKTPPPPEPRRHPDRDRDDDRDPRYPNQPPR